MCINLFAVDGQSDVAEFTLIKKRQKVLLLSLLEGRQLWILLNAAQSILKKVVGSLRIRRLLITWLVLLQEAKIVGLSLLALS